MTNYTKIRDFQYRLLQRAIVTNVQLKKWSLTETDLCGFCQEESETISHLMFTCPVVTTFWEHCVRFYQQQYGGNFCVNIENLISNRVVKAKRHIINTIILYGKQYVYKQRCLKQPICFKEFQLYMKKIQNTELYIAMKNEYLSAHNKKWNITTTHENGGLPTYIREYVSELQ